jgi:FkbM family methyltransferase
MAPAHEKAALTLAVCLYFLQANLALNRVQSVDILPVAILGEGTQTEFRINYRNLLVGIAGRLSYMGKRGHVIGVGAVPLDDLIELHDFRPPSFIKMDIEGAAVEAVKGMQKTIRRYGPACAASLSAWFPDACLQIVARQSRG